MLFLLCCAMVFLIMVVVLSILISMCFKCIYFMMPNPFMLKLLHVLFNWILWIFHWVKLCTVLTLSLDNVTSWELTHYLRWKLLSWWLAPLSQGLLLKEWICCRLGADISLQSSFTWKGSQILLDQSDLLVAKSSLRSDYSNNGTLYTPETRKSGIFPQPCVWNQIHSTFICQTLTYLSSNMY